MSREASTLVFALCVIASLLSAPASAQEATGVDTIPEKCTSTTSRYKVAKLVLPSRPSERQILYTFPNTAPKLEIDCLQLIDYSPRSNDILCGAASVTWLCKSPPEDLVNWECEKLDMFTESNVRQAVVRGTVRGSLFKWRIEYDPQGKAEYCFPRDIKLSMLATTSFEIEGSKAILVIFIVIMVMCIIIVMAFGGYQFRKTLLKIIRVSRLGALFDKHAKDVDVLRKELDVPFVQQPPDDVPWHLTEPIAEQEDHEDHDRHVVGLGAANEVTFSHEVSFSRDTFHPTGAVDIPQYPSIYSRSLPLPNPAVRSVDVDRLAVNASHTIVPPSVRSTLSPPRTRAQPSSRQPPSDMFLGPGPASSPQSGSLRSPQSFRSPQPGWANSYHDI